MSASLSTEAKSAPVGSPSGTLNAIEMLQSQQKSVMSGLSRELVRDDVWYLIAMPWFEQWKRFVGQTRGYQPGDAAQHPGKIDNSPILDSNGSLKRSLNELEDYTAVPEDCWSTLERYYGLIDEKTAVRRSVILTGGKYAELTVMELYPLNVSVCHHADIKNLQPMVVSRSLTVDELSGLLKQRFGISGNQEAQLWLKLKNSQTVELLTGKGKGTLEKLSATDESLFILETRNSSDPWMSTNQEFVKKAAEALGAEIKIPEAASAGNSQRFGTVTSSTQPAYATRSWMGFFNSGRNDEIDGVTRNAGTKGLCGLQNLGNTCFMNSAVQCLSNVPDLTEFFISDEYRSQINKENPLGMKGELAERYATLIKAIWSERYGSVSPREFKSTVGDYAPRFHGYAQQDSSELLSFLMDGLHEDLNRVKKKPYYEIKENDSMTDELRANEYWSYYRKRNDSKIVDLFHGQLKSTLRCNVCEKVVSIFDPFCYLSLPIPRRDNRPLSVYFRYSDPKRKVSKIQILVPRFYSASDVRAAVAKASDVPSNKVSLAGLSMSRGVILFYRDTDQPRFDEREEAMAFQVPDVFNPSASEDVPIVVFVKASDNRRALPYLIRVSRTETTPFMIHQAIMDLLAPFEQKDSNSDDSGDDENEPDYTIKLMNSAGTMVLDELDCQDNVSVVEKLRLGSTHYLCMNWKTGAFDRRINSAIEAYDYNSQFVGGAAASLSGYGSSGLQLGDCITSFLAEEQLSAQDTWYCPSCKEHQRAYKKFDIWRLPPYLIIHLKRFQQSKWRVEKMDTMVHYPLSLNFSGYLLNENARKDAEYKLIGVSNHYGGIGGGHYTAYCFSKPTQRWYTFDDSSVHPMNEDQVISKAGYLLVYKLKSWEETQSAAKVVTQQPNAMEVDKN